MIVNFLKEPVLHFALAGLALFAWFAYSNQDAHTPQAPRAIVIDDADVAKLISEYQAVWRRPPTRQELERLVASDIREEILVREALELGLDRGDTVIRSRLRQKMQFLTESAAQTITPSDDDLQDYLEANGERYRREGQIAFDQVYLGPEADQETIDDALARLKGGQGLAGAGQRTLLPAATPLSTSGQVDRIFGAGFADAVSQGALDVWHGPVASGYGVHLSRLRESHPARLPELAEVRDKVLTGWRRDHARALAEEQYDTLRKRYMVQSPDPATLDRLLAQ